MTPSEALVIGWTLLALSVLVILWVAVRRARRSSDRT